MRHVVASSVVLVAFLVSGAVYADNCSCSYGNGIQCSTSIVCPGANQANCSCTSSGDVPLSVES